MYCLDYKGATKTQEAITWIDNWFFNFSYRGVVAELQEAFIAMMLDYTRYVIYTIYSCLALEGKTRLCSLAERGYVSRSHQEAWLHEQEFERLLYIVYWLEETL